MRPFDLWGNFPPPVFSFDYVPETIAEYAKEEGTRLGVDFGGLSVAAITVCAAAINSEIKIKPHGWIEKYESARFWSCLVGDLTTQSRTIIRSATEPLLTIEREFKEDYRFRLFDKPDPDEKLYRRRMLLQEVTQGLLIGVMQRSQGEGMLVTHEEIGRDIEFTRSRPVYMDGFDGNLSMLCGLNPLVAPQAGWDRDLFDRLPAILLAPVVEPQDPGSDVSLKQYRRLVEDLHQLETVRFQTRNWEEAWLEFEPAARFVFDAVKQRYETLVGFEVINSQIGAILSRFTSLFLRICVIFHCVEYINEPRLPNTVSTATARQARSFVENFLEPHTFAFFSKHFSFPDADRKLRVVASFVLAWDLPEFGHRDVRMHTKLNPISAKDYNEILDKLHLLGWLTEIKTGYGGKLYGVVNPECHKLFVKQREIERDRRASARQAILEIAERMRG